MYLGYQNGKIKFYTEEELNWDLYALDNSVYTEDEYVLSTDGTEYVLKDAQWEQEQTELRKKEFYKKFLATSLGNYRLQPKGYANAQQSIDTVNNMVMAFGGVNETLANMVIFYETPDFTKEEECTEKWLIAHQYNIQPMTIQQWTQFYIEFASKYAQQMYKQNA